MEPARHTLEAEGLGKVYRLYASPAGRLIETCSLGLVGRHERRWALRDIDLRLRAGSALGLCGANGAGKSTLLGILAGTTAPTTGRYRVRGRVASLLELGAGFDMSFSGRTNILMNAAMMGIPRREALRGLDAIVDFAELGEHIDEPVRTYSTGMGMRLGFSVATAFEPDVLLLDEVFAVGDAYFQKKCVERILELKRSNRTIVFCSHSVHDVQALCDEALWLDRGRQRSRGDAVRVTKEYAALQNRRAEEGIVAGGAPFGPRGRPGRGEATTRVARAPRRVSSTRGSSGWAPTRSATASRRGDSIEVRVWWTNPTPTRTPIHVGIAFLRDDMTTCGGSSTQFAGERLRGESGCLVLSVPRVGLLSGRFLVPVVLLDEGGVHRYQEFLMGENLVVDTPAREPGVFRLAHEWDQTAHPAPA